MDGAKLVVKIIGFINIFTSIGFLALAALLTYLVFQVSASKFLVLSFLAIIISTAILFLVTALFTLKFKIVGRALNVTIACVSAFYLFKVLFNADNKFRNFGANLDKVAVTRINFVKCLDIFLIAALVISFFILISLFLPRVKKLFID